MAFVNISLLLGSLFAAIPIVVHLAMRREPRRQTFPALRFLRQRRETNQQMLQIRHWLLLALRIGLIAILAAALARPSVASIALQPWIAVALIGGLLSFVGVALALAVVQRRGRSWIVGLTIVIVLLLAALGGLSLLMFGNREHLVLGNERAPVAAALVFDTSPSMQYRHQNETRLDEVRETAQWLLRQLPRKSRIAIIDTRPRTAVFSVDLAAANKSLERLESSSIAETLVDAVVRAVDLVQTSDERRKEIYVFSDLTESAWPQPSASRLRAAIDAAPEVSVYVIDVGVLEPQNSSLGELELSSETLARSGELRIATELIQIGKPRARTVELLVEEVDKNLPLIVDGVPQYPAALERDQFLADPSETGSQRIEFRMRGLSPGVHHGLVRIREGDSLDTDDTRYFTVHVQEPWPILVVAPPAVNADLLTEAVSPYEFRLSARNRFACEVIQQSELAQAKLKEFAAVCLLDPQPLSARNAERLATFVTGGGGVAMFLGRNVGSDLNAFNQTASALMGGKLIRQWRSAGRELYLSPTRYDHPILAAFRGQQTSVPWSDAPVYRHWVFDPDAESTQVIIPFSNNDPAVIEQSLGAGRVVTLTTPVTDPLSVSGRPPWNELPTSENAWPYLVLVNELMDYLVRVSDTRLNFAAGATVVLPNDPELDPTSYQLFAPDELPLEVKAHDDRLTIRFTEPPGAYRLKGLRQETVLRGFSVNVPSRLTELKRIKSDELPMFLGDERLHYARQRDEILIEVGEARVGREFYPYLLTVLVVILGLEQLFANRFYRESA